MGAAFGHTCYPDLLIAQDAYFQAVAPVIMVSGNTVSFQNFIGVWHRVETSSSGVVVADVVAPLPSLMPCDHMAGFNDGLVLSVLLIGAAVSASMAGFVSRAR